MSKMNPKRKNKPSALKKGAINNNSQDVFHTIVFWGLAVLLFLTPYFRGLFFALDQERALIFAVVIFWFAWLWKWGKREYSFVSHPLDYFALALPVVYVIATFQAVNYGLAVNEVVKATLYFVVFWLASRLVRNESDIVTILSVIYLSAIGVALVGLGSASGIIHIVDGFVNGRIYSTYQYPNALASFLGAAVFVGLYLWRRAGLTGSAVTDDGKKPGNLPGRLFVSRYNRYLYAVGNFLLIAVLLGTKSQGGFLVFAVVFIFFMIGLAKGDRIPVLTHFVFVSIPAIYVIWRFIPAAGGENTGAALLWLLAGLILVLAGQALYGLIERKGLFQWISAHRNIMIMAVLVVVVSGSIGFAVYISGYGEAVKNLAEEIRLRNAAERIYFYQDALKMFVERPVIGWGGGGWQEAYRAYQGYLYNSSQVHGYYFQIMVETGIIGLLAILGIWASFLYTCHRLYHRAKNGTRFLTLTITAAAVLIGLHAAIDFDLSLSALALILWTMFGLARGLGIYSSPRAEERKIRAGTRPKYSILAIVSVVSVLAVLFTGTLAAAETYAKQSNNYFKNQNIDQSARSMQKAIANNPLNGDYHYDLAQILMGMGLIDEAIAETRAAMSLGQYDVRNCVYLTNLLIVGNKDNKDVVHYAEKTLSLAPYNITIYELLSLAYFKAGYNELAGGNQAAAKQYFEQALLVPDRITAKADSLGELEQRLWKDASPLTSTPRVRLNVGKAQYVLDKWPEAEDNLNAALSAEETRGEAALWLSVLKSRQGQEQPAEIFLEQANRLAPQLARDYEQLRSLQTISN
ncbi:MAG: O-antigen ligase family protein [Desulfotomaculaceae bacterium]|nr:O-antigen ligase family protein [Desulfotomaculaceae bacterium]